MRRAKNLTTSMYRLSGTSVSLTIEAGKKNKTGNKEERKETGKNDTIEGHR
jgi:hypothetical protein